MEGPVWRIAINYCPLETNEEKLKNQQNFCRSCPFHDSCEGKAQDAFEALKKDYLAPFDKLRKFAEGYKLDFLEKQKRILDNIDNLTRQTRNGQNKNN